MNWSDVAYCSMLGLCNFFIVRETAWLGLKEAFLQNIRNPAIRGAAFVGLLVTVAGGIAHRVAGFNPDMTSVLNWALVFGVPIVFGIALGNYRTLTKVVDLSDDELANYPSYGWSVHCPACGMPTKVKGPDCNGAVFPCTFCGRMVRTRREGNRITSSTMARIKRRAT
ncbi:MAG: hypothetical protein ONB30_04990 [candidate division KSB1 bacterium]|nr:hypothetical protein [candidate division KSB1 bacterium]